MRPQSSTLTVRQVHRCAAAILQDHLKLPDHGPKCRAGPLLTLLFYAAARLTSFSDACQSLRDAPSDEAARYPFLMPVICRGRDLDDPRGPSGTKVFLTWQHSGLGTYTLHDARKRSAVRLGKGDVSPAVRHRDDLPAVASGPDSDLCIRQR
jgi:hypothetical protein